MKEKILNNKELIFYSVLLIFLIILVICNNLFWRLGKTTAETESTDNNIVYLESNNVIYDVPYSEEVLD